MNERAIMGRKKAEQELLKLVEEQQKREKGSLQKRIIKLEFIHNQKQALELERERLKGAVEIMGHMNDEGDIEATKQKKLIEDELKEKEEKLERLESLNHALIKRERNINDELQEARKELINGLKDSRAFIRVKRMGELDDSAFHVVVKRKFSNTEAPEKIAEISSFWEDQLRDQSWHPFKIIRVGNNAKAFSKMIGFLESRPLLAKVNYGKPRVTSKSLHGNDFLRIVSLRDVNSSRSFLPLSPTYLPSFYSRGKFATMIIHEKTRGSSSDFGSRNFSRCVTLSRWKTRHRILAHRIRCFSKFLRRWIIGFFSVSISPEAIFPEIESLSSFKSVSKAVES